MKITIDREVLEQVLNSLERYQVKRQDERFADEITALQEALAQPQQEPVARIDSPVKPDGGGLYRAEVSLTEKLPQFTDLYTSPPECTPLTDGVFVPLDILEAAESSLGRFCSDEGWSGQDMQNMDNLSAYIAKQRKPLTDERLWKIWNSQGDDAMEQQAAINFARAIEAAHGIKDAP